MCTSFGSETKHAPTTKTHFQQQHAPRMPMACDGTLFLVTQSSPTSTYTSSPKEREWTMKRGCDSCDESSEGHSVKAARLNSDGKADQGGETMA